VDITLLLTTYNRSPYLSSATESILTQTYPNFELILWDDGSTDRSLQIARHYAQQDDRICLIAAPHRGRAHSLKAAHALAKGDYVGWVDSDDKLAPTALQEPIALLNTQPQVGMVYTDYEVIDAAERPKGLGKRC
jgi:glycosyltransferase involved in cell wall biosynthesis